MRRAVLLAGSAIVLVGVLGPSALGAQDSFPHEKHSVFFSDCGACRGGAVSGDQTELFPEFSTCAACHDGATAPNIQWSPPEARVSSLGFTHTPHAFSCSTCHLPGGEESLANMGFPDPETCLGCHEPGTSHQQAEQCDFCHARVVDFRLTGPGLAPPFHGESFQSSHAAAASTGQLDCMTCHTENTCTQCHDGMGSPEFHPMNFLASHGPEAFGRTSDCSSCHNSEAFCRDCHLGVGIQGEGVIVAPFHDGQSLWIVSHPQAARQDLESCVACHQQTDCLRCHSASSGLRVSPHGPDFNSSGISDRNQAMCRLCHGTVPIGVGG